MHKILPQTPENSARVRSEYMGDYTAVHLIHSIDLGNPKTITQNTNTLLALINHSAKELLESVQNQTPYDYKFEKSKILAITQSLGNAYRHFNEYTIHTFNAEEEKIMRENYADLLNALVTLQDIAYNLEKNNASTRSAEPHQHLQAFDID